MTLSVINGNILKGILAFKLFSLKKGQWIFENSVLVIISIFQKLGCLHAITQFFAHPIDSLSDSNQDSGPHQMLILLLVKKM